MGAAAVGRGAAAAAAAATAAAADTPPTPLQPRVAHGAPHLILRHVHPAPASRWRPHSLHAATPRPQGAWLLTAAVAPTPRAAAPRASDAVPVVVAWYNPDARQWQLPAPGDAAYHAHSHTRRLVPRALVSAAVAAEAPPRHAALGGGSTEDPAAPTAAARAS